MKVRDALSLHDVLYGVFVLNEGYDPHLCFTLGALQRVDFVNALYARGPTTLAELSSIITLSFFSWRRSEFSAFAPSPTGVSSVVSCDALVGFRDMTRELSEKLKSIKLMSFSVFGGVGDDIILY